jgi:hypothetical protein
VNLDTLAALLLIGVIAFAIAASWLALHGPTR